MSIEAGTKFLGLSSEVDTTERRSAQINKKSEHYTIEELTSHISTEVQNSIQIPDAVDADTIVEQLSSENYDTIRSNVKGYKSTIISIPSFDLTDNSAVLVKYSEHGMSITSNPPLISYDSDFFGWTVGVTDIQNLGHARVTLMPYVGGQTDITGGVFVTAEVFSSTLFVAVYDLQMTQLDNTSLLQFGLELEFRTY